MDSLQLLYHPWKEIVYMMIVCRKFLPFFHLFFFENQITWWKLLQWILCLNCKILNMCTLFADCIWIYRTPPTFLVCTDDDLSAQRRLYHDQQWWAPSMDRNTEEKQQSQVVQMHRWIIRICGIINKKIKNCVMVTIRTTTTSPMYSKVQCAMQPYCTV